MLSSIITILGTVMRNSVRVILPLLLTGQAALIGATNVVALTENCDVALAKKLYSFSMQVVMTAPDGQRLNFISGGSRPGLILSYTKRPFVNDNDRLAQLGPVVTALNGYLRRAIAQSKDGPIHGGLDVPQIVQKLARQRFTEGRLILIGNPVWIQAQEHSFFVPDEADPGLRWRRPSHAHFASDPNGA